MYFFLRPLGINSILIVISTALLSLLMHEFAHYLVFYYYGLAPEMHHNYVHPTLKGTHLQQFIAAGAGPLASFILGILFIFLAKAFSSPSLLKLFTLWLGLGNSVIFLGYLLIAPFIANGDTGIVYNYLGIPKALGIVVSVGLIFVIRKVFGKLSSQFHSYKSSEKFNQLDCSRQMILYPILASVLIVTVLNFPITNWVSALPTVFTPLAYISIYKQYQRNSIIVEPKIYIHKISITMIIVTTLTISLFRYLV